MKRLIGATLASLSVRNYRLFFFGQMASTIGTWAQKVAQAWLILELTGSGVALGFTVAMQSLPVLLLGPWAGLLADRLDKHRILIIMASSAILPAVAIGVITATGNAAVWIVLCSAAVTGIIDAFEKPARQSFIIEMVGPKHLINALTLNNIVFNAGRLVGPAIAGVLIVTSGLAMSFFVNAGSFVAVLISLIAMRRSDLTPSHRATRSKGQLVEGFRYVRDEPGLLGPLVLLTVTGLLVWEWMVTIPLLARDAFNGDAQVVGWMFAAMGGGAVVGALALAGTLKATNARLGLFSLIFSVLLGVVAVMPALPAALILLFLVGSAGVSYRIITNSIAQLRSVPEMRGRTVSLFMMATNGMAPFSAPLLGWLCEVLGVRTTLLIGACVTAATAIAVLLFLRSRDRTKSVSMSERAVATVEEEPGTGPLHIAATTQTSPPN